MKTLEIHNMDDFMPIQLVADFGTLIGTYEKGFAIIIEPYDARLPSVPDPVIQLACLDASLAMKPVFEKYQVQWFLVFSLKPKHCLDQPENYLFSLSKKSSGSKYPNQKIFNFENSITADFLFKLKWNYCLDAYFLKLFNFNHKNK